MIKRMSKFQEEMAKNTISYLEKVKADMVSKGWTDKVQEVQKNINYVRKYGHMPKGK